MKILILNQAFYPDVVATGQHASDLAAGLAEAGHEVHVICSARGYDNPGVRFPKRERWRGVNIWRVATTGLGKGARWRRAVDFASFMLACSWRALLVSQPDVIVAMTSPPLISFLGALLSRLNNAQMVYWTMDLNPDEAIATGWLREDSLTCKALSYLQLQSLRRAQRIVVLDRFMKDRILQKGIAAEKITVIAPWSHDDSVRFDEAGRERFRAEHGLSGKFVVMYAGNHSPCHPLDTLLGAAQQLASGAPSTPAVGALGCKREDIVFCFVGGGSEFHKVQKFAAARRLGNIVCLPYVSREKLAGTLSAADLHVVVMGDAFTGIVHPCKVYNIVAVGAPFLYIGPPASHVTDLLAALNISRDSAYVCGHGEVDGVVEHILAAAQSDRHLRSNYRSLPFSRDVLLPAMIAAATNAGGRHSRRQTGSR
ncbi:MAG: glycosyltransferase family 4 protein [Terriglobales bacterium]